MTQELTPPILTSHGGHNYQNSTNLQVVLFAGDKISSLQPSFCHAGLNKGNRVRKKIKTQLQISMTQMTLLLLKGVVLAKKEN